MREVVLRIRELTIGMKRYAKKGGMNHLINIINIDTTGAEVSHREISTGERAEAGRQETNIEGETAGADHRGHPEIGTEDVSAAETDESMTITAENTGEMIIPVELGPDLHIDTGTTHGEDADHPVAMKTGITTIDTRDWTSTKEQK